MEFNMELMSSWNSSSYEELFQFVSTRKRCHFDQVFIQWYLRVWLDSKLHWKQHIRIQLWKTYSSLWACRKAMIRNWFFYLQDQCMDISQTFIAKLRSLQRNYLRTSTWAVKTVHRDQLEVALDMPPWSCFCWKRLKQRNYLTVDQHVFSLIYKLKK